MPVVGRAERDVDPMIVVISGPVRAGKSARAARLARELGGPVTYVATARLDDGDVEMAERVRRHRDDRGAMPLLELWRPGVADLPEVVAGARERTTLLVDSLGTWIAGHLLDLESLANSDAVGAARALEALTEPLSGALRATRANVVLVTEETGWGLVPPTVLGRIFRDQLGRLSARIAREAERVELVVAGYAIDLKALGRPVD